MDDETNLVAQGEGAVAANEEEMLPKSRVNEIVKREKGIAAEKVRREMEAQYSQELEKLKSEGQPKGNNKMDDASLEDRVVNRLMAEAKKQEELEEKRLREEQEAANLAQMQEVANKYHTKMAAGKDKFGDFDEVMTDFEPAAFPQLVFLAAEMENTAEIMYELSKNPSKLASLHSLSLAHPKLAKKEIEKLSQSIAENQQALANNVETNAPLSRLKSSQSAGVDSGKMGLKDYKNVDWLRV
jgi:hypothetical protein